MFENREVKHFWQAAFFLPLGFCSILLAVLGIFLPVLPTTPFLLLAAYCFANSSATVHHWLVSNHIFGPIIDDWQKRGAITRKVKIVSTAMMLGMCFSSLLIWRPLVVVVALSGLVMLGVLAFIWSRPNA